MNLTLIYFVYGLAFFALGLAVLVRVRPILHREVAGRLRWLGLFGLLHGVGEWTAMARMPGDTQAWLGSLEAVLFATSFAALMYFGLGWALQRENLARLTTLGCLALWVGVWLALPDAAVADVVGRYLLGVPAGLAVLVGFFRRRELFGDDRLGRLLFRAAMTGVAAYASLTAIASPQDFFPASVLNHAAFEALVGTPVQLWRMLSAGLIATAVILALDRFDRHEKQQLAKSSEAAAVELRDSLDRLASIAGNIPGGVYRRVRHADGSIGYPFFSSGFRRIFDVDPDRMMADTKYVFDGVHADDRDGLRGAIEASARGLDNFDREFRIVGDRGGVKWCRSIARPRRRDNGDVVWDGVVIDITERKQAEAEAGLARARLQEALDSLSEGFIYFDADERLIACNRTYREYYAGVGMPLRPGTDFGEWTRAFAYSGLYAGALGREEEWIAERLHDFRNPTGPREYAFADGRWIRISERKTPSGGTAGIRMDITELKARERALAESEGRFRDLFESAPISIWDEDWSAARAMMDRLAGEGGVTGWRNYFDRNPDRLVEAADLIRVNDINRATLELYGATDKEAMIAAYSVDRKSPEELEQLREQLVSFLNGEQSWVGNAREKKLDGSEIQVRLRVSIPSRHAGDWARVLTTVEDVTEQRRVEQEVGKLNEHLERRVEERTAELRAAQDELVRSERLATLGRLSAIVSHELRNPLGTIRNSLSVIRQVMPDREPGVEEEIGRMDRNVSRCDKIIDELLDFARAREPATAPTALDPWLTGVLDELPVPPGLIVRRKLDAPGAVVAIDPDRMRRAVINIYDNACQTFIGEADSDGGDRKQELTIHTDAAKGRFRITVADTGPGIPPEVYDHIFDPLYSTRGFGVGLGLPIVRQIMKQHGGGIDITSQPGHGTRVVLWLPVPQAGQKRKTG